MELLAHSEPGGSRVPSLPLSSLSEKRKPTPPPLGGLWVNRERRAGELQGA